MSRKTYRGKEIEVSFDLRRCIHAAECGRRLQVVFDVAKRPWVQPDNAPADAVQDTINHCPSGALQYTRLDGGAQEQAPTQNIILIMPSAEYQVRGDVVLQTGDGEVVAEEYRLTLCRCGESANKPYCDNSHRKARFVAVNEIPDNRAETGDLEPTGKLQIVASVNGSLLLRGNFEVRDASETQVFRGRKAALCRCGQSANKPFCDGTHKEVGFQAS
ncbi:MAG: CDGSH iron-sulfur domain-containing protein [Anaerolineales bacterium]|nr:CDGSH iron-sulfur domain-containing protein [Anaerolineales bacterium]